MSFRISDEIRKNDKYIILWHAGIKVLRGIKNRLFLKKAKGMLFVGTNVKITHGKHIIGGKNVKFED